MSGEISNGPSSRRDSVRCGGSASSVDENPSVNGTTGINKGVCFPSLQCVRTATESVAVPSQFLMACLIRLLGVHGRRLAPCIQFAGQTHTGLSTKASLALVLADLMGTGAMKVSFPVPNAEATLVKRARSKPTITCVDPPHRSPLRHRRRQAQDLPGLGGDQHPGVLRTVRTAEHPLKRPTGRTDRSSPAGRSGCHPAATAGKRRATRTRVRTTRTGTVRARRFRSARYV